MIRCVVAMCALAVLIASSARAGDGAPATKPAPADLAVFDPNPDHLWNRLHATLLVRKTADGERVSDDMFPYLWVHSRHILEGRAHEQALRVMDEFLASNGEKLIADPARRLMLQRDMWAVFDWCAWVPDDWVNMSSDEPAAKALRWRLARIIQRLALSRQQIAALPDNYRAAVESHAFALEYDPARRSQAYLPPDLFDKDSAWICIENRADFHAKAVHDRSIFLALLQLPGGKKATEQYLQSLAQGPRQFPVGTKVALLRQALAVDDAGRVTATNVTESLQVRVYREIAEEFDPEGENRYERDRGTWQDLYEFKLAQRDWFEHGPGLRAVQPDEISRVFSFDRESLDPFEKPPRGVEPSPPSPPARTLHDCLECHQSPGAYSVATLSSFMRRRPQAPAPDPIFPKSVAMAKEQAVRFKSRRADWAMLQGMLDALRAP